MAQPRIDILKRFYTRFTTGRGCWEWNSTKDMRGYGVIKSLGKMYKAHRIAYAEKNGPIPSGMVVMHKCDNPGCVNPNHLVLGTQADNQHDKRAKGRAARQLGSAHGMSKLSAEQVLSIRLSAAPYKDIAAKYGISHSHIGAIKAKRKWSHL